MQKVLSFILSSFFRKGKEQKRWRDIKTGKFVKAPKFYRYSWGCKGIPVHHLYMSFTYFYWGTEKPDGEEKLLQRMEEWLGFDRDEWWFGYTIGFGEVAVEYDAELDGVEEYEP